MMHLNRKISTSFQKSYKDYLNKFNLKPLDYETRKNHVKMRNYYPKVSPQYLPKMRPSFASSTGTNYVISLFPKKNNYLCVVTKETFYRPLKKLYRYKSKWYMPNEIKKEYGLSKVKFHERNIKQITKKMRNKILIKLNDSNIFHKKLKYMANKLIIPRFKKRKKISVFRKRSYTRYKTRALKARLKFFKKKNIIKKYLNAILEKKNPVEAQLQKVALLNQNAELLNLYFNKFNLIRKIDKIKESVVRKSSRARVLKKRIINTINLTANYFSNFKTMQDIFLAIVTLFNKKKKFKKAAKRFNLIRAKQKLNGFQLIEKEKFVYNEEILDSNFMEPTLRDNLGITPANNLVNYFLSKIKPNNVTKKYSSPKKKITFRLKKKLKYKKFKGKSYYKNRRIIFKERSYNRFNVTTLKKKQVRWKKMPLSHLVVSIRKEGRRYNTSMEGLIKQIERASDKIYKKRNKKGLLYLSAGNLMQKLRDQIRIKAKTDLRYDIKKQFRNLVRLLKIDLIRNKKKISKFTRKIRFLKRKKSLVARKIKIQILNLRELLIRENQKLREEINHYRYTWNTSPFFNYDQMKTASLNTLFTARKYKQKYLDIMKKYPEGYHAAEARLKSGQYYTGLPLIKRKQHKALVYRFKRFIRSLRYPATQVLFWSTAGKMGFAGPKRPTPYAAQTLGRFISTKLSLAEIKFVNLKLHTKVNKYVRSFLRGLHMTEDNVRPVRIHKMIFPLEFTHGMLRKRKQRRV